jgi:hypothetical protein
MDRQVTNAMDHKGDTNHVLPISGTGEGNGMQTKGYNPDNLSGKKKFIPGTEGDQRIGKH